VPPQVAVQQPAVAEPAALQRQDAESAEFSGAGRHGHRISIRLRMVAILVSAIVLTTLVFGALILVTVRALLIDRIDAQLVATRSVAQDVYRDLVLEGGQGRTLGPLSNYVVVVDIATEPRTATYASRVDPGGVPELGRVSLGQAQQGGGQPYTVADSEGGLPWRVVSYPLQDPQFNAVGAVSVGLPMDADQTALRLAGRAVLIGLGVAALAAVIGAWAINRSLRPLRAVETTAAAIAAGDYARRMPEGRQDTEVGRLTAALNGMLSRIESAIRSREESRDRMRRFVADASHELRTPLAAIRGYAELHRQGAVAASEVPATFARVEAEARRLGDMVEDLLVLARLDELRPLQHEPVDLAVLAVDAAAAVRALDPERPVRVSAPEGGPVRPAVVVGDGDRLRQVLANLTGNVVAHTPPRTPVEIVVIPPSSGIGGVDVVDHGPGIRPPERERIFERFARLDASRARHNGGGAGLGLSIVSSVVQAHGGQVDVVDTPGGGATFRVRLPAEHPSTRDAPA
jgi:two-component system OmpR family sensor kinase